MKHILTLIIMLIATPVLAQDVKLKPQDLQELQTILQEQIPAKWAQPIIKWANDVMQRNQEEKVAGPNPPKKEEEKKPEEPKQP